MSPQQWRAVLTVNEFRSCNLVSGGTKGRVGTAGLGRGLWTTASFRKDGPRGGGNYEGADFDIKRAAGLMFAPQTAAFWGEPSCGRTCLGQSAEAGISVVFATKNFIYLQKRFFWGKAFSFHSWSGDVK